MPLTKEEQRAVDAMKPQSEDEDAVVYMDLFSDLLRAVVMRDLTSALECGESMASLESREKQKAFCAFAADCLRKIFLVQQKLPQIASVPDGEQEFYEEMAQKCPKGFCVKAVTNIEKVVAMIDRNVNSKILFCDLVNRMFMNI